MNIWMVAIGEPVPTASASRDRLHRAGYLAHFLADHGHQVTWWTSTFDHFRKMHHFQEDTVLNTNSRLDIHLLHGCGYASNISVRRVIDHREVARRFASAIKHEHALPDIIVSAFPSIELSLACVRFGKEKNIPVVVDLRDMWPDIFVEHVPAALRHFARQVLDSWWVDTDKICSQATAITGITEPFVEWGVAKAKRPRTPLDRSFPMGYQAAPIDKTRLNEAGKVWDKLGIEADASIFTLCFFGTIGRQFDLETPIRALRTLKNRKVRLVICGVGDRLGHYQALAKHDKNVHFAGWVDAARIASLMQRSSAGITPLPYRYDYLATINNKSIEYLSGGLPIISCPQEGVLFNLLTEHHCGVGFDNHDVNGLARLIERLSNSPDTLKSMSQNALDTFHQLFVAENVYREMMQHLQVIIERHADAGKPECALEQKTRGWYQAYYDQKGAYRNDLRTNPEVLFQVMAREASMTRAIKHVEHAPSEAKILNVGCGCGEDFYQLFKLGYKQENSVGIDILPERIAVAELNFPRAKLHVGDASRLNYDDGAFDLVFESTLFTTLTNDFLRIKLAEEMIRVCKPNGYLLLIDWRTPKLGDDRYKALTKAMVKKLFITNDRTQLLGVWPGALAPPVGRLLSKRLPGFYFSVATMVPMLVSQVSYLLQKKQAVCAN